MIYDIKAFSNYGNCKADTDGVTFTASSSCKTDEARFFAEITFSDWEDDCYIMMPACAYNGNRYKRVKRSYPPMYLPEETGADCEAIMTYVPALEPDGSGKIEVTTGDMAVPCTGIYYRHKKEGFLLFTPQQVKGLNIGFTVSAGKITLSYPANRKLIYRMCSDWDISDDKGFNICNSEQIHTEYKILRFPCGSMDEFFRFFFKNRKCLLSGQRAGAGYDKELLYLQENKFNEINFKSGKYYSEISGIWQAGWIGGPISAYALLKAGNSLSKQRAVQTLEFLADHQAESGFYYGIVDGNTVKDDGFGKGPENIHLIRKSADSLYFLLKCLEIIPPDEKLVNSSKKCADAFVTLFDKYKTFGQFVNVETGEMIVPASTAGAIAPAALAKAWQRFGNEVYIETAKNACRHYCEEFLQTGVTSGAPGEILCAPDSESAFALLESCSVLYEITKDTEWLSFAEMCACYCSSWVVTYPYDFPAYSEFYRLKINSVGAVFANVQNKHGAPGICTLSGDSLYKLFKATGNRGYLELLLDIASCIPQCVSTEERPIYTAGENPVKQPPGYICERINLSDWETKAGVGGVFYGSNWSETSLLLTYADLLDYPEIADRLIKKS